MDVIALGQVALSVADVARSTAFYRDAVGLRFLFAAGPSLAFLELGNARLMLSAPEGGQVGAVSAPRAAGGRRRTKHPPAPRQRTP